MRVLVAAMALRSPYRTKFRVFTGEACGSKEYIEMHHIHKLADLNKEGRREKPLWMKIMISRKRKSIPLCRRCHDDIHSNRLKSKKQGNRRAG
jgi:predicted HNH restriction endonuclease